MDGGIKLQLYVAGNSPGSRRARANLEAWCDAHAQVAVEVEVIDVFETPQRALADGVLLTPQLIVQGGAGRIVIVGNLSEQDVLSEALQREKRTA